MSDHDRDELSAPHAEPVVPELSKEGVLGRMGPYTLLSWLGSGGMGRVYLGREVSGAGRLAAVKVIRPEYAEDPKFRKRFEREVAALERVQGPYLARLMGSGRDGHKLWVATEYIPAPSLADAVDEHGPLDAAAVWRLAADLVQAIQAMARTGIVHRDLKPSNVLLAADGARVIDFGVAQAADSSSITTTGHYVGTAAYMAPEQALNNPVTTASDVFSLGCTLTYALTGQSPFGDGTGVAVMHRVVYESPESDVIAAVTAADPELAALVMDCLAKEPERRPTPETLFATAIAHQMPVSGGGFDTGPGAGPGTRPSARPSTGPSAGRNTRLAAGYGDGPNPRRDGAALGQGRAPVGTHASPAVSHKSAAPAAPATPAVTRKRRVLLAGAVIVTALAVAGGIVALRGGEGGSQASTGSGPTASPTVEVSPTTASSAAPSPGTSPSPSKKAAGSSASPSPGSGVQADAATLDIRSAACPATLSSGASGDCVTALQTLLDGWGIRTAIDGRFGARTVRAVKVFQTEAGVPADGEVDTQTKKYLYSAARGPVRAGTLTVAESVNGVDRPRCLESGSARVGRNLQIWDCDGSLAQQWALYRVPGRAGQYVVVAQAGHGCVDADARTAGTNGQLIQSLTCTGLTTQRWRLGDRKASGAQTLVSVPTGFCLDADAHTSGQDGRRVQGWGCAGNVPQDWTWI